MTLRKLLRARGLRTTDLVKKSGLSGFTVNAVVNHGEMSPTTRKIIARVLAVSPARVGAITRQDRPEKRIGAIRPVGIVNHAVKDGYKYDKATKNAIIEIARNCRLAGKTWKEVLDEAKKVGYAGSLQGVEKMTSRFVGKIRKSKIGASRIKPVAVATGSIQATTDDDDQVPDKTIETAVVNALYSARGKEGFSPAEAQTAISWAKNILQDRDNLERILAGKAKIEVEDGAVQVIFG